MILGSCKRMLGASLLLAVLSVIASAEQNFEFLPELDVYYKVDSNLRLSFQAKRTRENGDPTQTEIGPSIEFFLKPLVHLRKISLYDLDESKSRLLALSFGYRYLNTPGSPGVNRVLLQATPNLPLKGGLLISDRNRGELNFSNGDLTWRYRNEVTAQRTVTIHFTQIGPYYEHQNNTGKKSNHQINALGVILGLHF